MPALIGGAALAVLKFLVGKGTLKAAAVAIGKGALSKAALKQLLFELKTAKASYGTEAAKHVFKNYFSNNDSSDMVNDLVDMAADQIDTVIELLETLVEFMDNFF